MGTTVRDVMTTRVVALREDADYKEIVTALRRYRVSACPVIDEANRVIGLVSEADLLFKETNADLPSGKVRLAMRLGEQSKAAAVTADQLMTAPAVAIDPGAPVAEAARVMQDKQIKRDHRRTGRTARDSPGSASAGTPRRRCRQRPRPAQLPGRG
jgi:CBS domain-containing protein